MRTIASYLRNLLTKCSPGRRLEIYDAPGHRDHAASVRGAGLRVGEQQHPDVGEEAWAVERSSSRNGRAGDGLVRGDPFAGWD